MPVADAASDDEVGRFHRLSHTQADMHRRCPRMWYYRYPRGLLGGTHPIFALGHAVEGALNRVMRDSPALVAADAPSETFDSPIHSVTLYDSAEPVLRPDPNQDADWPGLRLATIDERKWPDDRDSLRQWATARAEIHFEREWAAARIAWWEDANRIGDWDSFEMQNRDDARAMVDAGIEFHLDEVEACIKADGGPHLSDWRMGQGREPWPAPDGFPYDWSDPHPAAAEGDVRWVEAWEVARPWFCDPDAGPFALGTIHPEGWFQGEYDLVYRWTGEARVFDVKASKGTSDFSSGYTEQLASYAYLWWVTHGRNRQVTELVIWYLGVPHRKYIPLPDEKALIRLENRLRALHTKLKMASDFRIEDFPAKPAPIRTYLEGGILSDSPPLTGMARCATCEYSLICPDSPSFEALTAGGSHHFSQTSAALVDCTPISELDPFVTVQGIVRKARMEKQWKSERQYLEFFLDLDNGDWLAVVIKQDDPATPQGFRDGSRVRIRGGIIAAGYKPELGNHRRLDVGPKGVIENSNGSDASDTPLQELRELFFNIRAKLFSFDIKGEKWGVRLTDSTGSIPFSVWGDGNAIKVLETYRPQRGDEVVIVGATVRDQFGRLSLSAKSTKRFQTRLWPSP